jgi:hypothetical protein
VDISRLENPDQLFARGPQARSEGLDSGDRERPIESLDPLLVRRRTPVPAELPRISSTTKLRRISILGCL